MARNFFSSLRVRLLLSVFVAGLPILFVVLYTGFEHRHQAMESARGEILRTATMISRHQQQSIELGRQLLTTLALTTAILERKTADCEAILTTTIEQHRRYSSLGAITPDGNIYCSAHPTESAAFLETVKDSDWFQSVVATRTFTLSNYLIASSTGKPTVVMSHPVLDSEQNLSAIVFASLDFDLISEVASFVQFPQVASAAIIDRGGVVLSGRIEPEYLPGDSAHQTPVVNEVLTRRGNGIYESVDLDGQQRIYAYAPLGSVNSEPGAYVLIAIPRAAAYGQSEYVLNRNLFSMAAAAFLALLVAWWGSELFLMRSVERLRGVTQRLAAGELSARTGVLNGPAELNQLAHVFDEMASSLQKRQTETESAQQALRDSEARYRLIIETAEEGIIIVDPDGDIVFANAKIADLLGYSIDEMREKPIYHFMDDTTRAVAHVDNQRYRRGVREQHDMCFMRKDGTELWTIVSSSPIVEGDGRFLGTLTMVTDITERKRAEDHLIYLAHHDYLTGLPNRTLFNDRLQQAIIDAERRERLVALLFMDLDRFKTINDTLGHEVGDVLLRAVSVRLKDCIRVGDTVGRLGGDEFIILLSDISHVDDVARIAQKVLDIFEQPYSIAGRELFVTTSIGITIFPFDDKGVDGLIKNADVAMYRAKEQGRNTYEFYSADMTAKAHENLTLEQAMRGALERDEFILHYQPIIDLATGEVSAMEALLRWQHPEQGLIMPQQFVPIAEESGFIVPIGEWALRTACAQARNWQRQGYEPVRLAVNLSARQFYQRNLSDVIARALGDSGLDSSWLELELTESLLMQNAELTNITLRTLNDMGVRLAIDDFGTGYSSLGYLKRFPLDTLKVSGTFVQDVSTDADDAAIVSAIIALAHALEMRVVAEGVETADQRDFLLAHACDAVQGIITGKPVPPEEFPRYLTRQKRQYSS